MKKKSIKKYIVLAVIVCFIGLCFALYRLLLTEESDHKAIYGGRLEGIKEVMLDDSRKDGIKKALNDTGKVKSVNTRVQGKIIECSINVGDDVSRDDSKSLADIVLNSLNDEEKAFYDIQVFIDKDAEDGQFPIIGYHHPKREGFSFTLDR